MFAIKFCHNKRCCTIAPVGKIKRKLFIAKLKIQFAFVRKFIGKIIGKKYQQV